MNADTIAAISTAPGEAGISIVRISGPDSLRIADAVLKCSGPPPSMRPDRMLVHGTIRTRQGVVDEVILLIMRAPHSYTREDVVEIQGHGGAVAARRVLRCVLEYGARPAEPGEFTRRAFLNGRIDLVQAEAVLDLIRARSDRAAQLALEQLDGRLSTVFNEIYDSLVAVASDLEASLDFSEDDVPPLVIPQAIVRLGAVELQMERILATWEEGHILREGALVVISGKPNVGKSTLMNCLLGRDRVIVSSIPGTTRDTIEETLILEGIPVRLVDTAGLRPPESEIESHGVARALKHVQSADVRIDMIDCSQALDDEDRSGLKAMNPSRTIIVLNKSDLPVVVYPAGCQGLTAVLVSCLRGCGLESVKSAIVDKLGLGSARPAHAAISERHRRMLGIAAKDLHEAIELLESAGDEGVAVAASRLRIAAEEIGQITGRTYAEDMLNAIFSRFCIGK